MNHLRQLRTQQVFIMRFMLHDRCDTSLRLDCDFLRFLHRVISVSDCCRKGAAISESFLSSRTITFINVVIDCKYPQQESQQRYEAAILSVIDLHEFSLSSPQKKEKRKKEKR